MTGAFTPAARAAILAVTGGRCAGCDRPGPLTCQHRRARGMGGSRTAGDPRNGLPLCGSGTTGCHGWAEEHPRDAALLGWRLTWGDTLDAPFWTAQWGWRRYLDGPGLLHGHVEPGELDRGDERTMALLQHCRRLAA